MTVVTSNNKEHRWMCFLNKSYLTKAVISQWHKQTWHFVELSRWCFFKGQVYQEEQEEVDICNSSSREEWRTCRRSLLLSYCLRTLAARRRIRMPSNCSCFIDEDRLTTARETNQYLHWNRTESEDTSTCDRNSVVLLFLGVHHWTTLGKMVPPKNLTLRPLLPSRTPVGPR